MSFVSLSRILALAVKCPTHRFTTFDSLQQSTANATACATATDDAVADTFSAAASFFLDDSMPFFAAAYCRVSHRGGVEQQGGDQGG